jgi:hypothetical protein
MYKKVFIAFVLVFSFNTFIFSQNGKLNNGKESLKTTKSTSEGTKTLKTTSSKSATANNSNPFARILWSLAAYTVYGVAVESPWEMNGRMHDAEISTYPYKNGNSGNYIYTDSTNYNMTRFDITNSFVIENKNLYGNNFGVNFRFLKRFALDVDYLFLTEKVNENNDSFSLYSALLKYYRVRTQKLDAWFGLGIMHVGSDVNKSGFGIGVGAEWFFVEPISAHFSHKFTSINSESVNKTQILLKYHLKNYHISSGYESFNIGVSKINTFSIGVGASF